ncbi:hypothetical protein EJV47_07740 [Hymenobacter gummosus]|uniref:Uncharacterized protein n=1 Tax=Hymenobacter gummosus TaxID=1776032 RepID=A0A3S0HB13_9BACT|nr:hypothetical protein [Hymenobacter gummosus]RTQ51679.1 hypothetical protein EJV47_07740 [Hymenobacter gummosus]
MKPVSALVLSLGLLAACQRTPDANKPSVSAAAAPRTAAVTPAPTPARPTPDEALVQAAAPAPEMTAFLKKYDVSSLWTLEPEESPYGEVLNGFFGPDKYRIEFVFTSVERDTLQPHVFRVRGKDRFKKVITPFEGVIVLEQLADQPALSEAKKKEYAAHGYDFTGYPNSYSAIGHFVLREDASQGKAGEFRGDVALDFRVDEDGKIQPYAVDANTPSKEANVLLTGNWTSYATGQRKPLVLVSDIFSYGREVFSEFVVGERDVDFNPKYAKLGWDSYWENDEWWADAPKTASL